MKRKKVLIADNFEHEIKGLRKALITAGYEVRITTSAAQLESLLSEFLPDILLIDARLPEFNLESCLVKVRQDGSRKPIPVILTGSPRTIEDRLLLLDKEIDEFFYKPFELEETTARVESLLKEAAQSTEKSPMPAGGFSGSLSEMSLVDLLQTLDVGQKSGTLHLQRQGAEGKVYIVSGEVIDAELAGLEPRRALQRMFTWREGYFSVHMGQINRQRTIQLSTQELVSEGTTRLFRWQKLCEALPPLSAIVQLKNGSSAPKVNQDERHIIGLLNGKKRFIDVVEESQFDDIKALRLLSALYDKGMLHDIKQNGDNHVTETLPEPAITAGNDDLPQSAIAAAFTSTLKKTEHSQNMNFDRRRTDRRRQDRRQFDRRHGYGVPQRRIHLNKSELIILREKLLSEIKGVDAS